jgi:hypothetical protein
MIVLTRQQRVALKRLYDRIDTEKFCRTIKPVTYKEFRRSVSKGWDCVMVYWCGMWVGIETDGYTHT